MRAEKIDSGLQARTWSFNRQAETPARQFALITDGTAIGETDGSRFDVTAPSVLWLGRGRRDGISRRGE